MNLIEQSYRDVLEQQRSVLQRLLDVCRSTDDQSDSIRHLEHLLEHLDEFFLLVVVGEVKAGKSAFINALLGEKVTAEGPTPVTDRIKILRYAQVASSRSLGEFVEERSVPIELLRHVNIVDTPGTNSIVQRHQEITEDFIPKADLILFVSSIDRPYSESEHRFLSFIRDNWRKKVLFVLSKIDTRDPEEIPQVVAYIRENCLRLHGFDPLVFPLSPKLAYRGRQGDKQAWEESRLAPVEKYIAESLTAGDKARLKLEGTIDAAEKITESLQAKLTSREQLLRSDFELINDLDAQVTQSARELKDRYYRFIAQIYDLLREFEQRGRAFFEERLRLSKVALLRDPKRFQADFEKHAMGDLKERIDDTMNSAVDWLIKEELNLYQRSMDYLARRVNLDKYNERIVGPASTAFDYRREEVFRAVRQAFQQQVAKFDIPGECQRILNAANRGVLQQIGLQVGAVGVGTVLVMLLTATWADVTGSLFAVGLFLTGFAVLPRLRRRAVSEFVKRVDTLVRELKQAVVAEFDREIESRLAHLRSCYDPYLVFYRSESAKIAEARGGLKASRDELGAMRHRLKEASAPVLSTEGTGQSKSR